MKEEMDFIKGKKKKEVKEKSVSKQQQKFFGVVRGMQKGDIPKKGKAGKAAEEMSKKDVKDFASTKHKNLPKKKETKESYTKGLQNAYANMLQSNLSKTVNPQFPSFDSSDSSIQENIEKMINKHITPKISKKDFLKYILERKKIEEIHIFTDNTDTKDFIVGKFDSSGIPIVYVDYSSDFITDFILQTLCDHFVIANSTFSYWSSFLSTKNKEKIVCCPMENEWFGISYAHLDTSSLLPNSWIKIKQN